MLRNMSGEITCWREAFNIHVMRKDTAYEDYRSLFEGGKSIERSIKRRLERTTQLSSSLSYFQAATHQALQELNKLVLSKLLPVEGEEGSTLTEDDILGATSDVTGAELKQVRRRFKRCYGYTDRDAPDDEELRLILLGRSGNLRRKVDAMIARALDGEPE